MNRCSKCKKLLPDESFYPSNRANNGLFCWCKDCCKEAKKQDYKQNPEAMKLRSRLYHHRNKKKIAAKHKKWVDRNKEYIRSKMREYYLIHKDELRVKNKKRSEIYDNLPQRKFHKKISRLVLHSLKGNKRCKSWEVMLGYNANQLKNHLLKTIPEGYSWEDYMFGRLHLDHVIPVSAFNFNKATDIDFSKCWALKNLQLLPAKENIAKGNKINQPFQPSLAF